MPPLNSHRYAADCPCPLCADRRADRKLAVIHDFIDWANAPLLAGVRRFVESRRTIEGVDVTVAELRENGISCRRVPVPTLRLLGHARA